MLVPKLVHHVCHERSRSFFVDPVECIPCIFSISAPLDAIERCVRDHGADDLSH